MSSSLVYVVRINGLTLPENAGDEFALLPGLQVTKTFRRVEKHLDRSFFGIIGSLESSDLRNAEAVAYTLGDAAQLQKANLTPNDFILQVANRISVLLHGLWLVKDHSAYPGLGFIQVTDGENILVHSNQIASNLATADGLRSTVTLTPEELQRASAFIAKLLPLFRYDFRLKHSPETASLGSRREAKRISRAIYFTSVARSVGDLGVKIVNYCTALETLFSTDAAELTHKVSQRTAVFMGGTIDAKVATYDLMKKAYGVRSKVVHGEGLANEASERIASISQSVDGLVRSVLVKILSSDEIASTFELNKEDLDRHYLRLSFG